MARRVVRRGTSADRPPPFTTSSIRPEITRITLAQPPGTPAPFDRPVNAYLLHPAPHTPNAGFTLINAGHMHTLPNLLEALAELGHPPEAITRIVLTGHAVDRFGAALAWPTPVDVFALSQPEAFRVDLHHAVSREQQRLTRVVDALASPPEGAHLPLDPQHIDRRPLDALLAHFLIPPPEHALTPIPLRDGMRLHLSGWMFRVLATSGAGPGEMALYCSEQGWLWTGAVALPDDEATGIYDAGAQLESLGVLYELQPSLLLPAYGEPSEAAQRVLRRILLFINNWMSNLPYAISQAASAPELVQQDLGYAPTQLILYATTVLGYQALFEELLRTGVIETSGTGLFKRYGVDVSKAPAGRGFTRQ